MQRSHVEFDSGFIQHSCLPRSLVGLSPLRQDILHLEVSYRALRFVDKLAIGFRPMGEQAVELLHLFSLLVIDGSQFLSLYVLMPLTQCQPCILYTSQLSNVLTQQIDEHLLAPNISECQL